MLGINAVKGFEYGNGFDGASARGSEVNDEFIPRKNIALQNLADKVTTCTNNSGGIQGGIVTDKISILEWHLNLLQLYFILKIR